MDACKPPSPPPPLHGSTRETPAAALAPAVFLHVNKLDSVLAHNRNLAHLRKVFMFVSCNSMGTLAAALSCDLKRASNWIRRILGRKSMAQLLLPLFKMIEYEPSPFMRALLKSGIHTRY